MYYKKNGYVAGVVLMQTTIKKIRDIVEFEKFQCRILKDDERTQEFETNTNNHKNSIYALRYNNIESIKMTEKGKKIGN